jgi:O-succinylbenzoate synthase
MDDISLFKKIYCFNLKMIEQPFYHLDIINHAKLSRRIDTPICLDESITSPFIARQALELNSCKYINIKPNRVGGLLNTIQINQLCNDSGVGCWIGGMLESDVGKGICADLCSLPNMTYPGDVAPANNKMKYSHVNHPLTYSSAFRIFPRKSIQEIIEPDEGRMKIFTNKSIHFE